MMNGSTDEWMNFTEDRVRRQGEGYLSRDGLTSSGWCWSGSWSGGRSVAPLDTPQLALSSLGVLLLIRHHPQTELASHFVVLYLLPLLATAVPADRTKFSQTQTDENYIRFGGSSVGVENLVSFRAVFSPPVHLEVAGKLGLGASPHGVGHGAVQVIRGLLS